MNKLNCSFWLQWTLGTIFGFLLSLLLIEIGERTELNTIEGIIGGVIIGIVQSVVLSQRISQAWLWLFGNLISWGLMTGIGLGAIGWVAPRTEILGFRFLYGVLFGMICGIFVGIMQWLVLEYQVPKAWLWLLISPLCWSIGLSLGWTLGGALRLATNLFLGEVIGLILTWIIVSAITGVALIWLLEEVPQKSNFR